MIALDIPPAVLPAEHHDHPGSGVFSYIARSPALPPVAEQLTMEAMG